MPAVDLGTAWWLDSYNGTPLTEALRDHDMTTLFRYLRSRGWSRLAISGATGLSETRVRAVTNGDQRIAAYNVLLRIAVGLKVPRGYMGLAYVDALQAVSTEV